MLVKARKLQTGDTLIEVLFAITVFSLVVVGALSIMNSGVATGQRALEISLVREQMDAQAETLRYIHDSYVAAYPSPIPGQPSGEWSNIIAKQANQASGFGACDEEPPSNAFIINTATVKLQNRSAITTNVQTYSQLRLGQAAPAEGLWVEAVKSDNLNKYVDFHIRACWDSLGLSVPMSLGTIVRLYEP